MLANVKCSDLVYLALDFLDLFLYNMWIAPIVFASNYYFAYNNEWVNTLNIVLNVPRELISDLYVIDNNDIIVVMKRNIIYYQ